MTDRSMYKRAFKMKLKPGCKAEYKKRHDQLWPELLKALKEAGIYDYSIFLDEETNILFAIHKVREDHNIEQLPKRDIMKKWWEYMADLMEVKSDNSPMEVELKEVFYMK